MTEFFTYELPNGIRCILKRIKSPVAWCSITINAGSRDETPREYGIAHFTEHLLFKGTQTRKAHHINNRLEKLGGELNAYTTKEETVVHATTLRSDFTKAVELISDIVFHSVFPEKEVARECEVIVDEINSCKDSPPELIYDQFEDMLFAGSALGHDILGSRSTVGKIRSEDIRGFTRRTYNTDQMVFSVVADITEAYFVKVVQRFFGDVAPSVRTFTRQTPANVAPFEKSVGKGTHQAHCIIGARAYSNNDPRRIPLALLVNMIGGPAANSALNMLLREKHGLTYNVEASYTSYCDTGIASIYFGTDKDKVCRCRELIGKVLMQMMTETMSDRQLAMGKKQLVGQLAISMESREGNMLNAGKSLLVYNEVDSPETLYRRIADVTAASVREVANEVFGQTSSLTYGNGCS